MLEDGKEDRSWRLQERIKGVKMEGGEGAAVAAADSDADTWSSGRGGGEVAAEE